MSAQAKKKLTQRVSKDFPQIILSWFQLIFSSISTQNIFQIRACLISAKRKTAQANGLQVAPKILHPPPPPPLPVISMVRPLAGDLFKLS